MNHTPYTRHKKPLNSEMNVVPYIDVMLVLLVIFMVTAPMLTTGVEVNLPSESTDIISQSDITPVIISLQKDGAMFISSKLGMDQAVDEAQLTKTLDMLIGQIDDVNQLQVMINADQDNDYKSIMHLMALIQKTGISKIGLLSGQPPNTP